MFDPSSPDETLMTPLARFISGSESDQPYGTTASPFLDEETRRQQILQSYQLVDTAQEPAYDDIVNMAALMCGTPTALVSLITEDRQWFKARVGMELSQTPRAILLMVKQMVSAV